MKYAVFLIVMAGLAVLFAGGRTKSAAAGDSGPVVLELFTSQSCSSCPPADRLLEKLAQENGVIALGCHITYWNHLSWNDALSLDACTARQKAYADAAGTGRVFTPELRINGADSLVGSQESSIRQAIKRRANALAPVDIRADGPDTYRAVLPEMRAGPMSVTLVSYGRTDAHPIGRGENKGRTVTYVNPVNGLRVIKANWDGHAEAVLIDAADLPPGTAGLAVLAQNGDGLILAAGEYRRP